MNGVQLFPVILVAIALFPFMKGITTTLGYSSIKFAASVDCTISVYEGNYDIHAKPPKINSYYYIALFPFMKGITTGRWLVTTVLSNPCNHCTISVYEGNYDEYQLNPQMFVA